MHIYILLPLDSLKQPLNKCNLAFIFITPMKAHLLSYKRSTFPFNFTAAFITFTLAINSPHVFPVMRRDFELLRENLKKRNACFTEEERHNINDGSNHVSDHHSKLV